MCSAALPELRAAPGIEFQYRDWRIHTEQGCAEVPAPEWSRRDAAGVRWGSVSLRWNSETVSGGISAAKHTEEAAGNVFQDPLAQTEDENKDVSTLLQASVFAAVARHVALSPDHLLLGAGASPGASYKRPPAAEEP